MAYVNVNMWRKIANDINKNKKVTEVSNPNSLPFPLDENGEPTVPEEYKLKVDEKVEEPVVTEVVEATVVVEQGVTELTIEVPVEDLIPTEEPVVTEVVEESAAPKRSGRKGKKSE